MAVKLIANYAKRLGLPGYSSHQFSVSVETELTDLGNVQGEATRLYGLLQDAIDREIQHVGFVPGHTYGMEEGANGANGIGANGNGGNGTNGHAHTNGASNGHAKANGSHGNNGTNGNGHWSCSDKQRDLIIKIVDENGLDRNAVEELAQTRFSVGVRMLNKLQASGLIAELIENTDKRGKRGGVSSNGFAKKGGCEMIAPAVAPADEAKAAAAPSDPTSAPLDYISASRLNCFHECRLKFYFRYVERIPSPTSPALFVGSLTHTVLQKWNLARWRGEPSDPDSMRSVFTRHWTKDQPKEGMDWGDKKNEVTVRENTWAMLEFYFAHTPIPVEEKPEAVEVVVERDLLAHGLPPLRGVIDLVREGGKIVDFKTASRAPTESQVGHQNAVQLGCYALLYREATGQEESGFQLHHLIKTKAPKLVVTPLEPMAPGQARKLIRQMESYVNGVSAEDYVPSPGQHCAWCDYFAECGAWGGCSGKP